ncbi:Di-copper centre-containing protein [Teratosphaeria destructans]|uniref:tyrosinase n=1 Tax=Teratosphaeria destructans TaxID=418781 RepID=A0A9W7SKI7_9PEZI|nr:Di-copper centre-containing protein [Teratosphaeria destructans]
MARNVPHDMYFRICTVVLLFFVSLASATPPSLSHPIDDSSAVERRDDTTGLTAVTGITQYGVQPRLEIRELQQNVDQWNLYLLGLARWQATNQSDKLSYYQVAGIHGRPYIPWDGVGQGSGPGSPGYCRHVSNIFLPWHRPYLALVEQTLFENIIDVVNEFPAGAERQRYASAALSFRLPYWDWAASPADGASVWPDALTAGTVTVNMPNGTSTIRNPLLSYQFHPVSQDDFFYNPFASWSETMRYPTNWSSAAVSQDSLVGPILDNNRIGFQDRLYNLFTNYNNFTQFGNEAWESEAIANADSLESIHDAIHSITGMNGDMTYLDYSAFDPVFWLHHAMIDRCFALWQAIWTDSYVEPMAQVEQSYYSSVGDVEDVNSPLEPFHASSNGTFWTSATVRDLRVFGYTYEALGNGSVAAVKAAINSLYGTSSGSAAVSQVSRRSLHAETARELGTAASTTASGEVVDGKYNQYIANIRSGKSALNGSYAIYIFIGDFDDTPSAWPLAPNLVGTHAVFAAMTVPGLSSSNKRQDMVSVPVSGTMPLTSMLLAKVEAGDLPCMDPTEVTSYLTENLHWRISMFDGTRVSPEDLVDFQVEVVGAQASPATSIDAFPMWGNYTSLTSITQGKPGGCS